MNVVHSEASGLKEELKVWPLAKDISEPLTGASRYSPLLKIWKVFNGCVIIFFKKPQWTTTKHVVDFSEKELGELGHKSMKNLLFLNYK